MNTYVVTGSASGIGAATAAALEHAGHRVVGIDLRDADVTVDLGTVQGRADAVSRAVELTDGKIDGFAGIAGVAPAAGRPARTLVSVNYFGTVEVLEGLKPFLAESTTAAAVLISSNTTTSLPNWPMELAEACLAGNEEAAAALADVVGGEAGGLAYPATKAAIAYYTRTRAAEYVAQGIRLNAVAPGVIDTPMSRTNKDDPTAGAASERYLAAVPAGRAGRPEEIASAIAYLLGPESSYTVGSVLVVDGGTDAKCRGMDWPRVWTPESSGSPADR